MIKDFGQAAESSGTEPGLDLGPESSFAEIKKRHSEIYNKRQDELRANTALYDKLNEANSKARIMKLEEELRNLPNQLKDREGYLISQDEWFRLKQGELRSLNRSLEEKGVNPYLDQSYEDYLKQAEAAQGALQAIDDKYAAQETALDEATRPRSAAMIETRRQEEIADFWNQALRQINSPEEKEIQRQRLTGDLSQKKQLIEEFLAFIEEKTPEQFDEWAKNNIEEASPYFDKIEDARISGLWKLGFDRSQIDKFKSEAQNHYTPPEDKINAKYDQMLKELI
jgi:hypothetical protein